MTVEDRLTRLERECRNWRRVVIGLVVLFVWSMDWSSSSFVTSGNLATAAQDEKKTSKIDLFDTIIAKKIMAQSVELSDGKGGRIQLGFRNNEAFVVLTNPKGLLTKVAPGQIHLTSTFDRMLVLGAGGFTLFRDNPQTREQRTRLYQQVNMNPNDPELRKKVIALNKVSNVPLVSILRSKTNGGKINVFNSLGKAVLTAEALENNQGSISLLDSAGKPLPNSGRP